MANSEIKAAIRTFYREKSYALINISGLSLAIACCLILGLFLRSELTYDRYHLRHKEIFRVVCEFTTNGGTKNFALTSVRLGPILKENFPEVKDFVRIAHASRQFISAGDKKLYWDDICWADQNIFDIFTHKIIYGDPKTALKDPYSAAVSESFARKHFGDANPIGKSIQIETQPHRPRKITLVYRDFPENTHLKYNVLFQLDASTNSTYVLWDVHYFTYLVMPENYDVKKYKAISDSLYSRFMEIHSKQLQQTWRSWLQPLADIHLHSDVSYDLPTGNPYYVYGFTAVAAFILLVACINYVNLALVRAAKRAKEIGMRKILGVSRFFLMLRFFGESALFALIAMIFGSALVEAVLRLTPVNELFGRPLALKLMDEPTLLLWLIGLSLFIGLLSGIYPAIYLSSLSPQSALSNSFVGGKGLFHLREALVLTQFTVSVIAIACTLIMVMQMRYVSKKPLGFEKHNRVIVNLHGLDVIEKYQIIKNELLKNSSILGVSASSSMIGVGNQNMATLSRRVDNKDGVPEIFAFNFIEVADNFVEVMGMQVTAGRDFMKRLLTDYGSTFIVNEAMVKTRGWKNPLGKRIQGLTQYGDKIIGVVKDFHIKSLHSTVEPFVMFQFNDNFQNVNPINRPGYERALVVHIAEKNVQQTLNYLQSKFTEFDPQHPFEYEFLDDAIDKVYMSEARLLKMIGIFSGICIFISCLGLFGLAAFTTEQRCKEIGVRKVLGASASQIVMMLARKTLWLVLAGSVVASIAAYFIADEWLTGFAYQTGIHLWVFIVSAAIVIAVAFITIAMQSYKTAQADPANMLRYE